MKYYTTCIVGEMLFAKDTIGWELSLPGELLLAREIFMAGEMLLARNTISWGKY